MHLIDSLKTHNIIKTGDFTLKSGQKSTIYCDFKSVITYPKLMSDICYELSKLITSEGALCGVPMGAISFGTLISYIMQRPMILLRETRKEYGTCNLIEGKCEGKVILIEDVITTSQSVIECIELLKQENIEVTQIICILDRQTGGVQRLQ